MQVILLKNKTVVVLMSVLPKMPIKFECNDCCKIYMYPYSVKTLNVYPKCPGCKKAGSILGIAEKLDIIKHPRHFIKSVFKQIAYMRGK